MDEFQFISWIWMNWSILIHFHEFQTSKIFQQISRRNVQLCCVSAEIYVIPSEWLIYFCIFWWISAIHGVLWNFKFLKNLNSVKFGAKLKIRQHFEESSDISANLLEEHSKNMSDILPKQCDDLENPGILSRSLCSRAWKCWIMRLFSC